VDSNLTKMILPQLVAALTVNGKLTGDLLLMGYYDPYQNICPNSVPYIQQLNQHLQADAAVWPSLWMSLRLLVARSRQNPNICNYTWICSGFHDIHARAQAIASSPALLSRLWLLIATPQPPQGGTFSG